MELHSEYSTSKLQACSYRYLQQMAKAMNLPSNVKKVELVEMINAKKCAPESEVQRIVRRVKTQRQHLKQAKKRGKRAFVQLDASESDSQSPPITITPKRPVVVRSSDMALKQVIVQSSHSLLRSQPSDRVLRSCNIKSVQQYLNKNLIHRETGTVDQGTQMRIIRKYQPKILSQSCHRQVVPISQIPSSNVVVKRPRLLSGIYPINREMSFMQMQSVGVRNREGKITKINAFIHKPDTNERSNKTYSNNMTKNIEITIQDIINGNLEAKANLQSVNYPNTSGVSEPAPSYPQSKVYYHKKIRSEQVRERRPLPPIQDAFNQFRPDLTQPLYVQVEQDDRMLNYPFARRNTNLLETVYNFKNQFLTHQPLLQIATTANTKCVYSTPTVATAAPHKPATAPYTEYMPTCERDNQCQYNSIDSTKMTDLRFTEDYDFRCNEEQPHTSGSSVGTTNSQGLGANVTISDMVEDALELISQDGDYMERMGMDVRMQCVLCNWAGPKIILESHIRKEHSSEIDNQDKRDWNITYSLGALVNSQTWSCRVIQHDYSLFVLSVKYEQPDTFMASLSSLSTEPDAPTGSLTIFNKVTGEPHTWAGEVRELPPNLPYDNDAALTLALSELNLLPNSANLKLVNGELVLQSPSKTSRVLNSTFRYVKFVRKLRALEDEQRKGRENTLKELKDKQYSDFFISCDRRSLINNVARRVDLCMAAYEKDLQKKRQRLIDLFAREEEANIRQFVIDAQAGAEAIWRDKQDRLAYLLAKRKKEHEDKYKDTPLSKCVHVLPCIVKHRAREAQEIQLYQMREKAARRAAERELDNMWYDVAMKESEALAARMEYDAIERARRDLECHKFSQQQMAQRQSDRQREKERLKQETLYFKGIWEEDNKKEEEAERARYERRMETARERKQTIQERLETVANMAAEDKKIQDTWDSLAGQGLADIKAAEELRRRKERELDLCNRKMVDLRNELRAAESVNDGFIQEVAKQQQEIVDKKRCEYLSWSQKTNREVRAAMIDQIKDRQHARDTLKQKMLEQDEYHNQLFGQLSKLADYRDLKDAERRKNHQKNLLEQIEYNKLLKERALQEEKDQIRKGQIAAKEYEQEIKRMMCRPSFSDELHPFMKQMAKTLKMKEKCPCSKPDYCAVCEPDKPPKTN